MSITRDGFSNELQQDKQQEIMLDSNISQSRHIEAERGLARWVPDEDVPHCPGLDNCRRYGLRLLIFSIAGNHGDGI